MKILISLITLLCISFIAVSCNFFLKVHFQEFQNIEKILFSHQGSMYWFFSNSHFPRSDGVNDGNETVLHYVFDDGNKTTYRSISVDGKNAKTVLAVKKIRGNIVRIVLIIKE